jgi:hypothetical protein
MSKHWSWEIARRTATTKRSVWLATCASAAVVAALAASDTAAAWGHGCPSWWNGGWSRCTIALGSASGDYAVASAAGTANRPSQIDLRLQTTTPQKGIYATWLAVCSRGYGAGSRSGHVTTGTYKIPGEAGYIATFRVRMPMRRPDSCIVSADAQLNGSGRLTVRLVAFQR